MPRIPISEFKADIEQKLEDRVQHLHKEARATYRDEMRLKRSWLIGTPAAGFALGFLLVAVVCFLLK